MAKSTMVGIARTKEIMCEKRMWRVMRFSDVVSGANVCCSLRSEGRLLLKAKLDASLVLEFSILDHIYG